MTKPETMVRTDVTINGRSHLLAQAQDVDDLKARIEAAAATDGRFVDFVVVGNRAVSVLISARTEVVVSIETVQFDPRDDGDATLPYGGLFDL